MNHGLYCHLLNIINITYKKITLMCDSDAVDRYKSKVSVQDIYDSDAVDGYKSKVSVQDMCDSDAVDGYRSNVHHRTMCAIVTSFIQEIMIVIVMM